MTKGVPLPKPAAKSLELLHRYSAKEGNSPWQRGGMSRPGGG